MGVLIEGKWHEDGQVQTDARGSFVRDDSIFRNWITQDGVPGITGEGGFGAEAGRYHLFVSPSCPWAHRAMILRKLKHLEDAVSMSSADRPKTAGWSYSQGIDDLEPGDDGVFRLHQVYTMAKPSYTGKVTVPTLWDRERRTIVNNESSEIIRMFNSAFEGLTDDRYDYYPPDLREEIDRINDFVYEHVNNGVYRAGFAKSQGAYEEAVKKVFHGLDTMERMAGPTPLPGWRPHHRGRLAGVPDAAALRPRLPRPLQVQPPARPGLSPPRRLPPGTLPMAGSAGDL